MARNSWRITLKCSVLVILSTMLIAGDLLAAVVPIQVTRPVKKAKKVWPPNYCIGYTLPEIKNFLDLKNPVFAGLVREIEIALRQENMAEIKAIIAREPRIGGYIIEWAIPHTQQKYEQLRAKKGTKSQDREILKRKIQTLHLVRKELLAANVMLCWLGEGNYPRSKRSNPVPGVVNNGPEKNKKNKAANKKR